MKKFAYTAAALGLSTGLLVACGPYTPGDCRYDNSCRNYPYDQNYNNNNAPNYDDAYRADFIDEAGNRYYLASDGSYYRDPSFSGPRYVYREGYYYPYGAPGRTRYRADFIDESGNRYYLARDGYYYRDPSFRGTRYYYDNGYYRATPPGGWQRPTQPENHPDKY